MSDLHPDHMALLAIAKAAFAARDDRHNWRKNPDLAAENHGVHCDALWDELERQVTIQDGKIPTIDAPERKRRKQIAEWRREVVSAALNAITEALDELADGPMMEDRT
jgi:uncharacterized protein with FMN-binding domain